MHVIHLSSAEKRPKEERRMHVPLRCDKIKTKKIKKKEEKSRRKGIKQRERKKEDSRLSEMKIIK